MKQFKLLILDPSNREQTIFIYGNKIAVTVNGDLTILDQDGNLSQAFAKGSWIHVG